MKRTLAIALIALVVGLIGGQMSGTLIKPAYAAQQAILVRTPQEVIDRCDFSKTIVVVGGIACVQK